MVPADGAFTPAKLKQNQEISMRRTFALCLLAVVAVAGNAFATGEGRIQGKITDAATKKGIPGATVTLDAVSGHTFHAEYKADKDGVYRFLILDATIPYKFVWAAPGYAPVSEQFKLKLGDVNVRDVALATASAAAAATPAAAGGKGDPAVIAYNEAADMANNGKVTEAIAKLEEAGKLKSDFTAADEALAKLYVRNKQYDKAIASANKALVLDTDSQDMFNVLAEAYDKTGDKVKAAEFKKKLPQNANALFNDAARLINSGKDGEAEGILKSAIAADPNMAQAYYELGMLYVRGQKNADAKTNLQKYLELQPNGKDAATAKEMLNYVK
jgi:tetratricopeptide (TPR) repeat protein